MVNLIRLICERDYTPDSAVEKISDSRVFDIPAADGELARRIARDMEQNGWTVTRELL